MKTVLLTLDQVNRLIEESFKVGGHARYETMRYLRREFFDSHMDEELKSLKDKLHSEFNLSED